jgi:hypothetical protein
MLHLLEEAFESSATTAACRRAVRIPIGCIAAMSEPSAAYLKTLPAVRERCTLVHNLAKEGRLQYFDYHPEKRKDVINFCVDIIQVLGIQISSNS